MPTSGATQTARSVTDCTPPFMAAPTALFMHREDRAAIPQTELWSCVRCAVCAVQFSRLAGRQWTDWQLMGGRFSVVSVLVEGKST
jgi:hypothetical protein